MTSRAKQAVGAANVGLAGAIGERLGLLLGIDHHLAGEIGDAVDEDDATWIAGILDAGAGVEPRACW